MNQIFKITIRDKETIQKIKKVDLDKARISFVEFTDPNVSAYFDTPERVVLVGGSGEVTIEVWEDKTIAGNN